MLVTRRRRVDWPILFGTVGLDLPVPKVVSRRVDGRLASLLSGFDEMMALEDPDAILRRAVELARERIGLVRTAIFLLDRPRDLLLGTWGTDLRGAIVDEHHIMYAVSGLEREAFRRAQDENEHFTVFDNCPILEHHRGETRVVGRGWVVATPIRSARRIIGVMFNDAGLSGLPADEGRQMDTAVLCSLLGTILDPMRMSRGLGRVGIGQSRGHGLVTEAVALLAKDPGIGARELAQRLDISLGRLARVFKVEVGVSLVDYRNRLRLRRFDVLLEGGGTNLLEAAFEAGFGSYAQFHRVFRAARRMTPREYLQRRR